MSRWLVVLALLLPAVLLIEPSSPNASAPGWMGIVVADLTPDQCRAAGVKRGVQVVEVEPGGPADRHDIEEGDLIIQYENQAVRSAAWLMGRIRRDGEGFMASVRLLREGEERWAGLVTLVAAPPPPPSAEQIDERFAALERDVETLTARIAALEDQ
jgi:serine protease Do